jgi:hypothetical protein
VSAPFGILVLRTNKEKKEHGKFYYQDIDCIYPWVKRRRKKIVRRPVTTTVEPVGKRIRPFRTYLPRRLRRRKSMMKMHLR